jgi:hypothetical protein
MLVKNFPCKGLNEDDGVETVLRFLRGGEVCLCLRIFLLILG